MALKIKTKAVEAQAPALPKLDEEIDLAVLTVDDLADRYGTLNDQVEAVMNNPVFAQFKLVQAELSKRLESDLEPTDTAEIQGKHWLLKIGACSKSPRKMVEGAVTTVLNFLGIETFTKLAKVNVGDLEKYLTPDQLEKVLPESDTYTKNRKITAKFLG